VTEDQPAPETTTIPIIKDNELRLAKMRRQLEGMFCALDLAHDEIAIASEAAPARDCQCPEPERVQQAVRSAQIAHQHH
jgi:hypothetical protein